MKKLLISALFLATTIDAHACSVEMTSASDSVMEAVRKNGWGFDNYQAICQKLNSNNAQLFINGQATVLDGRSIAWAAVSLSDKNLPIVTSDFGGKSTQLNQYASMNKANEILIDAINGAVNSMDIEKSLTSLNNLRKKVKATYK